MSLKVSIRIALAVLVALTALFLFRLHNANGANPSSDAADRGHRLADAWCKECHAIEVTAARGATAAMAFAEIANQPSTTALSVKVFLRTSHRTMPNLVILPEQAEDLVSYILSLKRD
jgi:mono/diheme cytochrome c family protein